MLLYIFWDFFLVEFIEKDILKHLFQMAHLEEQADSVNSGSPNIQKTFTSKRFMRRIINVSPIYVGQWEKDEGFKKLISRKLNFNNNKKLLQIIEL